MTSPHPAYGHGRGVRPQPSAGAVGGEARGAFHVPHPATDFFLLTQTAQMCSWCWWRQVQAVVRRSARCARRRQLGVWETELPLAAAVRHTEQSQGIVPFRSARARPPSDLPLVETSPTRSEQAHRNARRRSAPGSASGHGHRPGALLAGWWGGWLPPCPGPLLPPCGELPPSSCRSQ